MKSLFIIKNYYLYIYISNGGDYGDLWWLANESMEKWLNRLIKKGNQILNKLLKN